MPVTQGPWSIQAQNKTCQHTHYAPANVSSRHSRSLCIPPWPLRLQQHVDLNSNRSPGSQTTHCKPFTHSRNWSLIEMDHLSDHLQLKAHSQHSTHLSRKDPQNDSKLKNLVTNRHKQYQRNKEKQTRKEEKENQKRSEEEEEGER